MAEGEHPLVELQERIIRCTLCPRLVRYRQEVARTKRRAFREWEYWGRPVPAFGSLDARLLIVGLAPAAHGANRTGRMFTGDRSGDFLYATLHRFGFCNQAESRSRHDGLRLQRTFITAALRCAPPQNRPTAQELTNCRAYLRQELLLLKGVQVVVTLGRVAFQSYLRARQELAWDNPVPWPAFGHCAHYRLQEGTHLIASYHPSQQNTQTGRLTQEMFDRVFRLARSLLGQ